MLDREVRKSRPEGTSAPSPPTRRASGAEVLGDHQRLGCSGADASPGLPRAPPPAPRSAAQVSGAGLDPRGLRDGAAPGPGSLRRPFQPRTSRPRPRDPRRPSADRRPSPEEGVGAVVVDLGLGAAAARGRAVRRLLQRGLACGHRGPRPRSPGAPALAPPHGASALSRSAPRLDLTHTGSPRTCRALAGSAGKGSRRLPAGSQECRGWERRGKGGRGIVGLVVRAPGPRGMLGLVVSDLMGSMQCLLGRMPPGC